MEEGNGFMNIQLTLENPYSFGDANSLNLTGISASGDTLADLILNIAVTVKDNQDNLVVTDFHDLPSNLKNFVVQMVKTAYTQNGDN